MSAEDIVAPEDEAPVNELEAAVDAERAKQLQDAAAERPDIEEDETVEQYVERLREAQVANTRTDR